MVLSPKSFLYEHDAATGVVTITLNRPDRLNALTFEVYREMAATFRTLDTEPGVRAIIITGAGISISARWTSAHNATPARPVSSVASACSRSAAAPRRCI